MNPGAESLFSTGAAQAEALFAQHELLEALALGLGVV